MKSGFAAIIGRPNVGKSTLLNRLIGQKVAIISDKPQTTRNRISGIYNSSDAQIIFIDTPGIHRPKHKLGMCLVRMARNCLREVDVILYVVDACAWSHPGEKYLINMLDKIKTPVVLVLNKTDLLKPQEIKSIRLEFQQRYDFDAVVPLSALKGHNVQLLTKMLVDRFLEEGPQYYPVDMVSDQPEKLVIAELIREKILHLTREEVPHAVAVVIEELAVRDNGMVYANAVIYIEKESQKAILIGKNGQMLKEIGRLARLDVEKLLGSRVFLDLWVKIKKDWRNRDGLLKTLGYIDK